MPPASQPASDRRVDVAVVCALELETAPLVKRLARRRKTIGNGFVLVEGTIGTHRVAVVQSGTTRKRLAAAADAMLFAHRPRWVIAAGFAVGLSDAVHTRDVVLASELVDAEAGRLTVDLRLAPNAADSPGTHAGRLISVPSWPLTSAKRRELGSRTGAVAADLHSFSLASLCAEQHTRFLAVRVLTGDVCSDAEPGWRVVYGPSSSYRAGVLVGAFLSESGRAGRLWKLRAAAKKCAERLAAVLFEILPRLP